jgi:hypothetical protein
MRKRWLLVGGAAFLALTVTVVAWRLRERASELQRESQALVDSVQRIARLATVEVTVSNWQTRRDKKPLFGFIPIQCEKTLAVFYKGKVGAGFDLQGTRLQVETDRVRRQVRVRLPPARLLYTDVPAPSVMVADGSLCNRFTPNDATDLAREARRAIEDEALARGVLTRAESHARQLIEGVVRPFGYELALEIEQPLAETPRD